MFQSRISSDTESVQSMDQHTPDVDGDHDHLHSPPLAGGDSHQSTVWTGFLHKFAAEIFLWKHGHDHHPNDSSLR